MKPIAEVYPDEAAEEAKEDGYFYGPGDYTPLLDSFGYRKLLQVDDEDYQGDSRVLYHDGGSSYGVLIFGWGSCSGCDALQACESLAEIDKLRSELHHSIEWKTRREMIEHLQNKELWEGRASWHEEETKAFLQQAAAILIAVVE